MENNLENIRNTDAIYQLKSRLIADHLPSDLKKLYEAVSQLPIIATDTYYIHYSILPLLKTKNNDKILDTVLKQQRKYVTSREFNDVHVITKLNDELSMIYAIQYTKKFLEAVEKELEKQLKKQWKNISIQMPGIASMPSQGTKGTQQAPSQQQIQQALSWLINKALAGDRNAQQLLQQLLARAMTKTNIQKMMKQAAKTAAKAAKTANEIKKILEAGVSKTGTSFDKLLDLTNSVIHVRDVDKIISLANKIYAESSMFVKLRKVRDRHGDEVAGYRTTRRIEEAIPRDLALPEELFLRKLIDGFTAVEKRRVVEGAYYVLIDKSGSMMGMKTIWSRSVALALLRLARKKKRKYFMRMFDTMVYPYDKPLSDPRELLETILRVKSSGGTDITGALLHALDDLKRHRLSRYTNTIIIITDGEDYVNEAIVEEFKKNNATLVAVMIAGRNSTLQRVAEKTGGRYLKAQPTEDKALEILEIAGAK